VTDPAVNIERMKQNNEDARARLKVAGELAVSGLRSITIINGGSIVALFTLVARGDIKPAGLVAAFAFFAAGVTASLMSTLVGYWSQQLIVVYEQDVAAQTYEILAGLKPREPVFSEFPNRLVVVATLCALAGIVCFVGGSLSALLAAIAGHR
jgi:hypothetical protein